MSDGENIVRGLVPGGKHGGKQLNGEMQQDGEMLRDVEKPRDGETWMGEEKLKGGEISDSVSCWNKLHGAFHYVVVGEHRHMLDGQPVEVLDVDLGYQMLILILNSVVS